MPRPRYSQSGYTGTRTIEYRAEKWLYLTRHFESPFKGMVGSVFKLKQACVALGYE